MKFDISYTFDAIPRLLEGALITLQVGVLGFTLSVILATTITIVRTSLKSKIFNLVLAFYISHKEKFQELRPLNLLFYSIFEWCMKEKVKVYDFGIFTVDGEPNMGLGRFKENFGASGIFRDTFQIIF